MCFDVDCTITVNDTLDLLAEFMGVGEEVAALTHKARPQCINKPHVRLLKQLRGRLVRGRTASTACRSVETCLSVLLPALSCKCCWQHAAQRRKAAATSTIIAR